MYLCNIFFRHGLRGRTTKTFTVEEVQTDKEFDDEKDINEEDILKERLGNSDSEQEMECEEKPENLEHVGERMPYFMEKDNRTKWSKHIPPKNVRTRRENITTHLPGPRRKMQNYRKKYETILLTVKC